MILVRLRNVQGILLVVTGALYHIHYSMSLDLRKFRTFQLSVSIEIRKKDSSPAYMLASFSDKPLDSSKRENTFLAT